VLEEDQCPINTCEIYKKNYPSGASGYLTCDFNDNSWANPTYTLEISQASTGLRGSISVDLSTLTTDVQYCILCRNFADSSKSNWIWGRYVVKKTCTKTCTSAIGTITPVIPSANTPIVGFISESTSNTRDMGPRIPIF
jgi:hypothetical protein